MSASEQSAPLLRKQMLTALNEKLLPHLRSVEEPKIFQVGPPYAVPPEVTVTHLGYPPLKSEDAVYTYPDSFWWAEQHMHFLPVPSLRCTLEGEMLYRSGATEEMAKKSPPELREVGGFGYLVPAFVFNIAPAGLPVNTGHLPPWETGRRPRGPLEHVSFRFLPTGMLCNLSRLKGTEYEVGYSLLVEEPATVLIFQVLEAEVAREVPSPEVIRGQLLALMIILQRSLLNSIPAMTDGLYSRFPDSIPAVAPENSVLTAFHNYVVLHLHEDLSPESLAAAVSLSAGQLNRLVRTHLGTTTMKYVRARRIETAKLLLARTKMPVGEVTRLVGYSDQGFFSRDFKSETGQAPLRFRQTGGIDEKG